MIDLAYTPLERLRVPRPVHRGSFVVERCRSKAVLDLGCYDETALVKRGTDAWLHTEIARVAKSVLGVDSSDKLPAGGLTTGPTSRIVRCDVSRIEDVVQGVEVDVIVAGELIEHLPNTLDFLGELRRLFPGRELVATTPNATSLTNVVLGAAARESSHPDHLQLFSYKTLNTLCKRAGFAEWAIIPYHVYYTEMKLRASRGTAVVVGVVERVVNLFEMLFPLWSGGLILHVQRI